jgi:acyl-CoA synthetase (AMP-forming)/AMP-acid ligase II
VSTSGVGFVDRLASYADRPALLSSSEVVTYRDLDSRVSETLERLGHQRRLVLLEGTNTVSAVTTYLAALRGNHPVLLADGGRRDRLSDIVHTFDPDVIVGSNGRNERNMGTKHDLHPNLRLLLSTSGSTGSPKLVRLSADNLQSNAESISLYLRLTPDDRAISSLPLAYCYGLSVLHSHLAAGASVVLTDLSVIDPQFWRLAEDSAVTSFAGVPHTFALLDRTDEPWFSLPTLRYVTQAGGRLTPREVQRINRLGRCHGWDLYVMYGQTEATARMAYLEPGDAEQHPHSIGRPIPGGTLRIDAAADGVGELVYSGPNVMMGYASQPADLAEPGTLAELRTGDLARSDVEGRFTIVGRASRFAKLLGHRIDLDQLQGKLGGYDRELVCASDDSRLVVAVTRADPALIRRAVSRLTGLPPGLVSVRQYAEIPRLPNGKPDLPALIAPSEADRKPVGDLVDSLRRAYGQALGYDRVAESASFVQLGGDSLSFVEVSIRLEELLGHLPHGWPEMSIRELAATANFFPEPADGPEPAPSTGTRRPSVAWLDTSIVLRALAITLVVLVHLEIWGVRGGAHLLLGIAGFTFARFQLSAIRQSDRIGGLARSITRLAIPSVLFIAILVVATGGYSVANIFLVNHYFGPPQWTETWNFWFVEALVAILLAVLALLAIPTVRRFERRHSLLMPALLVAAGLLVRYDVFGWGDVAMRYGRPYMIFWLFALGWLAQRAQTTWQRVAISVVLAVTLTGYFPDEPVRGLVVQVGLLMLIWLPTLPVPRLTAPVLRGLAAASLWIYLTHWVIWPFLLDRLELPRLLVVAGCLLAGTIMAAAVTIVQRNLTRVWRGGVIALRRGPAGPEFDTTARSMAATR